MQLLLSKRADAHAVAKGGSTPASVAASNGHHAISALLLSWSPGSTSTSETQSSRQVSSRMDDDLGLASVGVELSCQGTNLAQNAAVEVIQSVESAPAEEVTQRLADQVSRVYCSDVGGLSDAKPPPLQKQHEDPGDEGSMLRFAGHAHDVCRCAKCMRQPNLAFIGLPALAAWHLRGTVLMKPRAVCSICMFLKANVCLPAHRLNTIKQLWGGRRGAPSGSRPAAHRAMAACV